MTFTILQGIYYGSYLVAFILLVIFRRKLTRGRFFGILLWGTLLGSFVRARRIEPQRLVVRDMVINTGFTGNVVLIADMHLGPYKQSSFLQKVVDRINTLEDIDAVLVAGDFTYEPTDTSVEALTEMFAPLQDSRFPVIAVLGNHDVGVPGPILKKELLQALNSNDVITLENDRLQLQEMIVVGLGAHLRGSDDVTLLDTLRPEDNVVVLTHNPDTTLYYTNYHADVTLVGHTHCGQVRFPGLPFLYRWAIPVVGDFDCGLYDTNGLNKVYITRGLGEVMLPLRLFNPPTIDVVRLR